MCHTPADGYCLPHQPSLMVCFSVCVCLRHHHKSSFTRLCVAPSAPGDQGGRKLHVRELILGDMVGAPRRLCLLFRCRHCARSPAPTAHVGTVQCRQGSGFSFIAPATRLKDCKDDLVHRLRPCLLPGDSFGKSEV